MFNFAYKDWTAVHKKIWYDLLKDNNLFDIRDKNIIEVGCFEGRSTVWFSELLINTPNSRYFCIDTWKGGEEVKRLNLDFDMNLVYENFQNNIKHLSCFDQITVFRGNSESCLSSIASVLYKKIDFIYLDGSHTQRDTLVDLVLSLTLIKQGGLILIDDYRNNMSTKDLSLRPTKAVNFVIQSFENEVSSFKTPEGQMVIKKNK
jgi:predicted O-methyltransferase YrrM